MKYEIYEDEAGEWRWRLIAANGKIIATSSEGYKAQSDCQKGVSLVKSSTGALVVIEGAVEPEEVVPEPEEDEPETD